MTFTEEVLADQEIESARKLEQSLMKAKTELAALNREKKLLVGENQKLLELLDMIQTIEAGHQKAPAWASPARKTKSHSGTVNLMLSDLHLDEVVDPGEIEGLNAYNRKIAEGRLKRCVDKTIMLSRDYISGIKYDGMYLMLGGDTVSGDIHDELKETNECPVPETIDYWLGPLSAAIGAFVEEYGKVHVAGVVGNHPRNSLKPRAKRRVTDNIDWLIYRMLMRDFRNDDRVTWQIPHSADALVQLYSTRFLLTHGDQFRGGSGIAGALSPLMIGAFRKTKRSMQIDQAFDYLVMGHWHNYAAFKSVIVNGSLVGYNEYAYLCNLDYEPPQQAFWITTPENKVTISAPVLVQDRKKEGW